MPWAAAIVAVLGDVGQRAGVLRVLTHVGEQEGTEVQLSSGG
jgi:hypothetical protein